MRPHDVVDLFILAAMLTTFIIAVVCVVRWMMPVAKESREKQRRRIRRRVRRIQRERGVF